MLANSGGKGSKGIGDSLAASNKHNYATRQEPQLSPELEPEQQQLAKPRPEQQDQPSSEAIEFGFSKTLVDQTNRSQSVAAGGASASSKSSVKVTLSKAERDSGPTDDDDGEDGEDLGPSAPLATGGQHTRHQQQQQQQQLRSRDSRRSTSTLISASDSRRQLNSLQEAPLEPASLIKPEQAKPETAAGGNLELPKQSPNLLVANRKHQPLGRICKELPYDIHGKLRSDSIFCRSTSSSSFVEAKLNKTTRNPPAPSAANCRPQFAWARKLARRLAACQDRKSLGFGSQNKLTGPTTTTTITTSYKLNPASMFLRKAMRYYRIWIYCTNATIFIGTLLFVLASLYVVSDFRIKLLVSYQQQELDRLVEPTNATNQPQSSNSNSNSNNSNIDGQQADQIYTLSYTEPLVLVAYLAIAFQAGLLQAIGCFGAIRMKERWIQAFWVLILALTVFDVIFLAYWLNRYDMLAASLSKQLNFKLQQRYGNPHLVPQFRSDGYHGRGNELPFEQTFSEIIDKIQTESRCCGIDGARDYKTSRWRKQKLVHLESSFASRHLEAGELQQLRLLLEHVPLVPASCCRQAGSEPMDGHVIFDNNEHRPKAARVPAWSPSMVIEQLEPVAGRRPAAKLLTLAKPGDQLEQVAASQEPDSESGSGSGSETEAEQQALASMSGNRRRLLAKAKVFNRDDGERTSLAADELEWAAERRKKRWTVESTVDSQERIFSRLVGAASDDELHSVASDANDDTSSAGDATVETDKTTSLATESSSSDQHYRQPAAAAAAAADRLARLRVRLVANWTGQEARRFRAKPLEASTLSGRFIDQNELQLSVEQYKLLEGYLLKPAEMSDGGHQQDSREPANRKTRSIFSTWTWSSSPSSSSSEGAASDSSGAMPASETVKTQAVGNRRLQAELQAAVKSDRELECAPKSYRDLATINADGCYPNIKAYLESSAHILFVAGFCILTVLKICSLVLLRLEIREMIHKIKVLKGMATEYTEVQDLEAYLPCSPQPAELDGGVTLGAPASGSISGAAGHVGHRLGGSFSDAVAAAAAAAVVTQQQQQQQQSAVIAAAANATTLASCAQTGATGDHGADSASQLASAYHQARQSLSQLHYNQHQQQHLHAGQLQQQLDPSMGLASSGRAMSMRAMAAISNMLQPSLCARSSSAHLNGTYGGAGTAAAAAQRSAADLFLGASGGGAKSVHSGLGGGPAAMYRRHTAVSVCPAAAAAAAAAAAHQFMSRRGTYVANPIFNAAPLINSGFNQHQLGQHRHSAHTVHSLGVGFGTSAGSGSQPGHQSNLLCPQLAAAHSGRPPRWQPAVAAPSGPPVAQSKQQSPSQVQQSTDNNKPGDRGQAGNKNTRSSAGSSSQLLSLLGYPPFKRQSSAGAQSACVFSPDPRPSSASSSSHVIETRRSIH